MDPNHEIYMRRCLELARKGKGFTRTNPLVGSVIVHHNRIIGEGYHHEYGGPHAEVNAIRSVSQKEKLSEATMYVNLEPCSHFGKTPPCTEMIRKAGIPRVVIANRDPFPSVSGRGIEALQRDGVEVITGVLEQAGAFLNRRFLTFHSKKRPYIILKWAETADGYIDLVRKPGDPVGPNWITNEVARTLVHKWRSEEMGLMVGTNTIIVDNPRLNVRQWHGPNPLRITVDRNDRIPENANILDGSQDTLLLSTMPDKYEGKAKCLPIEPDYSLLEVLEELYREKLLSVMVEGGRQLIDSFIREGRWDEARVFRGSARFGEGLKAPNMGMDPDEIVHFQGSDLKIYYFESPETDPV